MSAENNVNNAPIKAIALVEADRDVMDVDEVVQKASNNPPEASATSKDSGPLMNNDTNADTGQDNTNASSASGNTVHEPEGNVFDSVDNKYLQPDATTSSMHFKPLQPRSEQKPKRCWGS